MKFIFPFLLFATVCFAQETRSDALQPKDCIAKIIALDDSLGKARNHACETISLSETIRQYAQSMEKFDYHGCPEAFAAAFRKHREAWLALLPVTDEYPDSRGEMHVVFKQIESGKRGEQFKSFVKTVWDTWAEVEAAMK